jgi:hypothetical protein
MEFVLIFVGRVLPMPGATPGTHEKKLIKKK